MFRQQGQVPSATPASGRSIGDAIGWVQTDPMFLVFPGGTLLLATLTPEEIDLRDRLLSQPHPNAEVWSPRP